MHNIKELNKRISALQNMQKVMRAMNMIASIKLRKLIKLQASLELFETSVDQIARDIRLALAHYDHPMMRGFKTVEKAHVIIFTADRGLCGAHNSSVNKALDILIRQKKEKDIAVDVTCIGGRGKIYCRRKEYTIYHEAGSNERALDPTSFFALSAELFNRFLVGEVQEIYLICNYFVSNLQQDTKILRLMPLNVPENGKTGQKKEENNIRNIDTAYTEPKAADFIVRSGILYIYYKLRSALLNSYLSEQSSRMTAMENATNNSEGLIDHYATLRNRARQAAITNELIEIISGKESLKG